MAHAAELPVISTSTLMTMAASTSESFHLNLKHFNYVIACESSWDPNIQSQAKNPDGSQENSWGIVQINLDQNPTITKAQAVDPSFALNFMASSWASGLASHWTCYRKGVRTGWAPLPL